MKKLNIMNLLNKYRTIGVTIQSVFDYFFSDTNFHINKPNIQLDRIKSELKELIPEDINNRSFIINRF